MQTENKECLLKKSVKWLNYRRSYNENSILFEWRTLFLRRNKLIAYQLINAKNVLFTELYNL